MKSLETKLGRAVFRNPIFGASGCTGHGYEMADYVDLACYGGISLKTATYRPRPGNRPQRVAEVPSGVITSIGLQNAGIDRFLDEVVPLALPAMDRDQIIISVAGDAIEEYVEMAQKVNDRYGDRVAALEINAACPNVTHGVGYYSRDPQAAFDLIRGVRGVTELPLFMKFNTNFENYLEVAAAVDEAGLDALYTTNTPLGLKLDIETMRPAIGNVFGPICGPAIRPIGMMRTWHIYNKIKTPIIASGGVRTWQDVIEYMLAGASAVAVGSAQFARPDIVEHIVKDLEAYMARKGLDSLSSLVGAAHK